MRRALPMTLGATFSLTLAALLSLAISAPSAHAFGFKPGTEGFSVEAVAEGGAPAALTGSHPYQLRMGVGFEQSGGFPEGDLRDLRVELPVGMALNPSVVPPCATSVFNTPRTSPFDASRSGESCPDASQVGVVEIETSADGGESRRFGVFSLDSPHGVAMRLGFAPYGAPIVLDARMGLLSDGRYSVTLEARDVPQSIDITGFELTLWGTPWGVSHDGERGNCLNEAEPDFPWAKCWIGLPLVFPRHAFITLPVQCAPSLAFGARASSWQGGEEILASAVNRDPGGGVVPVTGCESVPFEPNPIAQLTVKRASSASGLRFLLAPSQEGVLNPVRRAPSPPREAVVQLPPGVTVNPSVGAGLGACTPAQFAAESAASSPGQHCPDASKIGEFRARTPLFADRWFEGSVYLAQPDDPTTSTPGAENPFDSLLAVYLVTRLPERGILVKLAGRITAERHTGDLTAHFTDLPNLPYTDLQLDLRPGQRAFLTTPQSCGTAIARMRFTPWAEGAPPVSSSTPSPIETGADDGPCPAGTPPFEPTAITGGANAQVGTYTPYFVRLSRKDTEQEITSYSLELPKGLTGKLAGIPFCSDQAIAEARRKRGFAEIADPSCPEASRVGRTLTGYGIGQTLAYAPGAIYLAGPHNGQPLSLVSVNAATIGPFDLGTYVIRSAFAVDKRTAQLRVDAGSSDPIPHIVDGIPLHLRDIRIYIDRHQFTRNPSSCEASQMVSTLTGSGARFDDPSDDSRATVARRFQLFNCRSLGFRPKLGLRLRGGSKRGEYPTLRATFASRGDVDSNLRRIEVSTPPSLFLAQEHIRSVCTRVQFEAERCPPRSVYGKAVAQTPLFDDPLRGEVYLRSSTGKLPDLVALLRAGEVRIVLEGRIGPGRRGGIRAYFAELPDAPIRRFVMTLYGGRRGLLVNSVDICKQPPRASVKALAQNNLGAVFSSELRGQCRKGKKGKGGKGGGGR